MDQIKLQEKLGELLTEFNENEKLYEEQREAMKNIEGDEIYLLAKKVYDQYAKPRAVIVTKLGEYGAIRNRLKKEIEQVQKELRIFGQKDPAN